MLQPRDVARDRCWAIVADEALPVICQGRRRNGVQLPSGGGRYPCVGCCRLPRPCFLVRARRQQLSWPISHGTHGDGRHCRHQRRAVRWCVLPESRGVPGKVAAGCSSHCHSAARAVQHGTVRGTAPPLFHRGGRIEWGTLRQCLPVLFMLGRLGWLWVLLCAQALRMCGVRVLSALLRGRLREEEGSV